MDNPFHCGETGLGITRKAGECVVIIVEIDGEEHELWVRVSDARFGTARLQFVGPKLFYITREDQNG